MVSWIGHWTRLTINIVPNQCTTKENILPVAITLLWGIAVGTREQKPASHPLPTPLGSVTVAKETTLYTQHCPLPPATRLYMYTHSVAESETSELISVVRAVFDRKRTPSCTSIYIYISIYTHGVLISLSVGKQTNGTDHETSSPSAESGG